MKMKIRFFFYIIDNAAENVLSTHHVYINTLLVYIISTSLEMSILLSKETIPPTGYGYS